MKKRPRLSAISCLLAASALASFVLASAAPAQTFPTKPVRIIVPFPPGGAADINSRVLAEHLGKTLAQSVIVENRPGAGAVIGYELGARAPGDGHTITIVFPSFVINPSIRRVNYDPIKDFKAIAQATSLTMAFAVHPSVPATSIGELIALARARPGEISYGTPGVGTIQHVLGELFALTTKVKLTHVPYAGLAPANTALAGGHISMVVTNLVEMAPFVTAGKIRPVAVTSAARADGFPAVPTLREADYAGLEATNWAGFVAPAATPAAAITRLNSEIVRALRTPDVQEKFKVQGMSSAPSTPEQFAALLQSETARYAKVVREAGIKAE
jgi:tripartite-type tricarboxylate transporter receptor subunit TctC